MVLNWQKNWRERRDTSSKVIWSKGEGGVSHPVTILYGEPRLLGLAISINKGWFISHHDFRIGCDPLQQGEKIQGGSSPTIISEWGVTTPPHRVKKYRVVRLPPWFRNGVWPPPTGWKNTGWYIPPWFRNGVWPPRPPRCTGEKGYCRMRNKKKKNNK